MHDAFEAAVLAAGGVLCGVDDAEAIVWADPAAADKLPVVLARAARAQWVQLPFAGIEPFAAHLDPRLVWTCGKGVYARPVAEHVVALALAGMRGVAHYARTDHWSEPRGRNLLGARVVVLGGGGITTELVALLAPFGCEVTVVRRHAHRPVPGARVVPPDERLAAVRDADLVVVALALTPETTGVVDAALLAAMAPTAWLVNVGRGAHVVTDDLVAALAAGTIGGACLDVTDPEPLPAGHPLWTLPNCVVTPHIANTPEMGLPLITRRVRENVERFARGAPLLGLVDVALGY